MIIQVSFYDFLTPDDDPQIAVNSGYEIQIDDVGKPGGEGIHKTGAIYNFAIVLQVT